jgi:hypothetical protein
MDETQDQTVSKTHEDAPDGAFAVGFPLPESNSATPEAPTNASSEWESNQVSRLATEQPPLTRSNFPTLQIIPCCYSLRQSILCLNKLL